MIWMILVAGCKKTENVKLYTDEATQITSNSAVVSGEVKSDVLLDELGVCYGTSANPTIHDKIKTADSDLTNFSCKLTNLQEEKIYYARTYAMTKNGNIYYGDVVSFEIPSGNISLEPTIVLQADKTTISLNEEITFTMTANANTTSNTDLQSVRFFIENNGYIVFDTTFTACGNTFRKEITLAITVETITSFDVTAVVTDEAGFNAAKTVTINVNPVSLIERTLTWYRDGGSDATGLAEFGLEWKQNLSKAIYAVVKPVAGAKLYKFETGVYANVTTETEKLAAFESATEIQQWKEFNVQGATTQNVDYVLGTKYNGEYYLINITKGVIIPYSDSHPKVEVTLTGKAK